MIELQKVFDESNKKPFDVNKIMVINGPGSFTGIRIGVTVAKIYAWACNINVIPISSLKAYALSNKGYDYYVSIIDARRDSVYAGIYDNKYNSIMEDTYITKEELINKIKNFNNVLVVGNTNLDGYDVKNNDLNIENIYNYYKKEEGISSHMLNPVYLKKTEAEEKIGDIND
jgi:tRNA threonylcarbamoyladenosine biosynthesis protein TsaB